MLLLASVLMTIFAAGCSTGSSTGSEPTAQKVPNFSTKTIAGTTINFSDLWGKPIVLNFGASWCGPCNEEAPVLAKMYQQYKDRVNFLGMAVKDEASNQRAFAQEHGLTYTIGLDPDESTFERFRELANVPEDGIPTTLFIDKNGYVVAYYVGPISEDTFNQKIGLILQ